MARHATQVLFTPDGKMLLAASYSGVHFLDPRTGEELQLLAHPKRVEHLCLDPVGKLLLTATDKVAWLWDVESGRCLVGPLSHDREITHIEISPMSRTFLTVAAGSVFDRPPPKWNHAARNLSNAVQIWDSAGNRLRQWDGYETAAFSPDANAIAIPNGDHTITIKEIDSDVTLLRFAPTDAIYGSMKVAFSPDGRRLAVAESQGDGAGLVRIWNISPCDPMYRRGAPITPELAHPYPVDALSFSPDGQLLLTRCNSFSGSRGEARLWEIDGKPASPPLSHNALLSSGSISADGRRVLTAGQDGLCKVWDLASAENIAVSAHGRLPGIVADVSPDGRRALTLSTGDAQVWDLDQGKPLSPVMLHLHNVTDATFGSNGKHVITASGLHDQGPCEVRVWSDSGVGLSPFLRVPQAVRFARLSVDARWLLTATWDHSLIWDLHAADPAGSLHALEDVERATVAAISPNGQRVLAGHSSSQRGHKGAARIWDTATGKSLTQAVLHPGNITQVAFNPVGDRVVTACDKGTVRIWDPATGKEIGEPLFHHDGVDVATFSPDGRFLVTASKRVARVWQTATGEPVTGLLEHAGAVSSALFDPSGNYLVTISGPPFVPRVWDIATGDPITPALSHRQAVLVVNGRSFVSPLATGVPVWHLVSDTRAIQELEQEAELLSGQRFDREGNLVPLTSVELQTRWHALRSTQPSISASQDGVYWHSLHANAAASAERWDRLLFHLQWLVTLQANLPEHRLRRGWLYIRLGKWEEALADFSGAKALGANSAEIGHGRGLAQCRLEKWAEARQDLMQAARTDPARTGVWTVLGLAHAHLGARKDAVLALFRAAEQSDDNHSQDWSQALGLFEKATAHDPQDGWAWFGGPEIVPEGKVAHGAPGTTAFVTYENDTVRFWDSKGLEPGEKEKDFLDRTRKFVRERQADPDLANHIHLVWYCIQGCGARVTPCDLTLIQEIFSNVLVLVTKDDITRDQQRQSMREHLVSRGVVSDRILSCSESNLESLKAVVRISQRMLPKALQDSFRAAQLVDLDDKKAQAQYIIHTAAAGAAAAGAIPIPFSDSAIITPIQISMVVSLAVLYGFQVDQLKTAMLPYLAQLAGIQTASSLSKFIPGLGSVVQASVAGALTEAIGQLTNQYLASSLEARLRGQPLPTFHVSLEQISDFVLPRLPAK